jgi:hypothetical protein
MWLPLSSNLVTLLLPELLLDNSQPLQLVSLSYQWPRYSKIHTTLYPRFCEVHYKTGISHSGRHVDADRSARPWDTSAGTLACAPNIRDYAVDAELHWRVRRKVNEPFRGEPWLAESVKSENGL